MHIFLKILISSHMKHAIAETTDFFDTKEVPDMKIVPDGAFILRSLESSVEELFLVEMDMGTEGIVSRVSKDFSLDLYSKIQKYDKYLLSFRWADKYRPYGNFDHFILLFITIKQICCAFLIF